MFKLDRTKIIKKPVNDLLNEMTYEMSMEICSGQNVKSYKNDLELRYRLCCFVFLAGAISFILSSVCVSLFFA